MNCWDISGVEGVSQCYFDGGFQLMWVKVACGSVSEFIVVSYLLLLNAIVPIHTSTINAPFGSVLYVVKFYFQCIM